jgi:hypothetical protein
MGARSLVLIHEASEVEAASAYYPPSPSTVYYALTPEAMHALDRSGISYVIGADVDADRRAELIREEVLEQSIQFMRRADELVREHYRQEPFVPPFESSAFRLFRLFGSTRLHLHYLTCAIRVSECDRIVFFSPPDRVLSEESFATFEGVGSLETALLRFGGWPGIERVDLVDQAARGRGSWGAGVRGWWGAVYAWARRRAGAVIAWRKGGFQVLQDTTPSEQIGAPLDSRQVAYWGLPPDACLSALSEAGYSLVPYLGTARWRRRTGWSGDSCFKAVQGELRQSGLGCWEEADWSGFFTPLVRHVVRTASGLSWLAREAEEFCRRHHIVAGLSRGFPLVADKAIAQGFQRTGVPVVVLQHGAYFDVMHNPYLDYYFADYMLTFGDSVRRVFERASYRRLRERQPAIVVPVGMPGNGARTRLVLPKLLQKFRDADPTRKCIGYATTHYYGHMWIGLRPIWYDTELYRAQKAICAGLDQLVSRCLCKVILKLHPTEMCRGDMPDIGKWRARPSWLVIKSECAWTETLQACDAIVLDFPITALLEATLTTKPVFVLTKFLRFEEEVERILRRRVALYADPEALVRGVEALLVSGEYPADVHDDLFVLEHVDPFGDGGACQRVVEVLDSAIKKSAAPRGLGTG